jgi:hypothetical protein
MSQYDTSPWPVKDVSCPLLFRSLETNSMAGSIRGLRRRKLTFMFPDSLHSHCGIGDASSLPRMVSMAWSIPVLPCKGLPKGRALVCEDYGCCDGDYVYSPQVGNDSVDEFSILHTLRFWIYIGSMTELSLDAYSFLSWSSHFHFQMELHSTSL